jgi:hypothetical protein
MNTKIIYLLGSKCPNLKHLSLLNPWLNKINFYGLVEMLVKVPLLETLAFSVNELVHEEHINKMGLRIKEGFCSNLEKVAIYRTENNQDYFQQMACIIGNGNIKIPDNFSFTFCNKELMVAQTATAATNVNNTLSMAEYHDPFLHWVLSKYVTKVWSPPMPEHRGVR